MHIDSQKIARFACAVFLFSPAFGSPADAGTALPFLQNVGQLENSEIAYYTELATGTLFVTETGDLVYSLQCPREDASSGPQGAAHWAFRERFVGCERTQPAGSSPSPVLVSRFVGNDPESWYPELPAFDAVDLGELQSGIRVELRAASDNVEKFIHVAPGASLENFVIAVDGIDSLCVDNTGQLVLHTSSGEISFTAPDAYQIVEGQRQAVDVDYTLSEDGYGFILGEHRRDLEVTIDPLLASTFLGGMNPSPPGNFDDDIVRAMTASGGFVYVAGATQSPNFPIVMGYDGTLASNFPDAFVTMMTSDLSTVVASTFLGTSSTDGVNAIAIDSSGSVVIAGQAGFGFPVTPGGYTHNGTGAASGGFVARLSADLSTLLGSAIVTPGAFPQELTIGNGGIYFGGTTNNPGFPITPGAYRSNCCPPSGAFGIRPFEGFAGRVSFDLMSLEAMTYLGGFAVSGMDVAGDGTVFITDGADNAITGSVSRFDPGLTTRLAYLSYYPGSTSGSSRTYFNDVVVDGGTVIVVGQSYMNDLPATPGAFDMTCGTDGLCNGTGPLGIPRSDGFVARYTLDLQQTIALTYLGGSYHESVRAVALSQDGSILVVGETGSFDFPTSPNGADGMCGTDGLCNPPSPTGTPVNDAFLVRFSADLGQLIYGSYLGGSQEDVTFALAPGQVGDVFVGGQTRSADFPTTAGAFDQSYNGGTSDAFISRFDPGTGTLGAPYCMANPNSTGVTGTLTAVGSPLVANNDVTLMASDLPVASFGFFIVGPNQGFSPNAAGSSGNLCLGLPVGRFVGAGQIKNTGAAGSFDLLIDLTAIPGPMGSLGTAPGDTWNFQTWHRDSGMTGPTSNFTNGLSIVFQ